MYVFLYFVFFYLYLWGRGGEGRYIFFHPMIIQFITMITRWVIQVQLIWLFVGWFVFYRSNISAISCHLVFRWSRLYFIYYTCMWIPNHDVLCITYRHTGFILEVLIHYTSIYLKYFLKWQKKLIFINQSNLVQRSNL